MNLYQIIIFTKQELNNNIIIMLLKQSIYKHVVCIIFEMSI